MTPIIRSIRAATAATTVPHVTIPAHLVSADRLVRLAVEAGAMCPTQSVLNSAHRFSRWGTAALHLVFAPDDTSPERRQELVDECDRHAGFTAEALAAVITNVATVLLIAVVALPIWM